MPSKPSIKIRAGASAVQLYSALAYQGLGLVAQIAQGLDSLLAQNGFANVADAVGTDRGPSGSDPVDQGASRPGGPRVAIASANRWQGGSSFFGPGILTQNALNVYLVVSVRLIPGMSNNFSVR